MMERFKALLLSLLVIFTLAACGTTTDDTDTSVSEAASLMDSEIEMGTHVFTLNELSEFNGKDGNKAYVAVDGVVYDVTDVEPWANGEHAENLTAGNELSDEILESPHGKDVLEDVPVVGTLEEE